MSKDLKASARFHKQDVWVHSISDLIRVKAQIPGFRRLAESVLPRLHLCRTFVVLRFGTNRQHRQLLMIQTAAKGRSDGGASRTDACRRDCHETAGGATTDFTPV